MQEAEDVLFYPTMRDRYTLHAVLENGLSAHFGRSVRIVRIEAEPEEALSTHPIERLYVDLDDGSRLPVIFKRPGCIVSAGDPAKGGVREILVYRDLLAGGRFGAPYLYAYLFDPSQDRYWLLLEDVGFELLQDGDDPYWCAAAECLAMLHGTDLGQVDELEALGYLPRHDAAFFRAVVAKARSHLVAVNRPMLRRFDALSGDLDRAITPLLTGASTLIHGDIFPHNLAIGAGPAVRPLDWESAAIGLPAWDLARLLDGWPNPTRSEPFHRYLQRLAAVWGRPVDRVPFERSLESCEVINAYWHLAWDADQCADRTFVQGLLDEIERLLDGMPHG